MRDWRAGLRSCLDELLDAVYPPACRLCGARAEDGLACRAHVLPDRPAGPRCGRCAATLPPALPDGRLCPQCQRLPKRFERTIVLGDYQRQPTLREWTLRFKHGSRPDLARPLAFALGRLLANEPPALLVPVPAHGLRRWERGYDPPRLLAEALGRALSWPAREALERTRPTPVQGAPGAPSRTANVRGAFAVEPADRARLVLAPRVWLVDDVITTGATVRECARVLRAAGARRVAVAALARAGEGQVDVAAGERILDTLPR